MLPGLPSPPHYNFLSTVQDPLGFKGVFFSTEFHTVGLYPNNISFIRRIFGSSDLDFKLVKGEVSFAHSSHFQDDKALLDIDDNLARDWMWQHITLKCDLFRHTS